MAGLGVGRRAARCGASPPAAVAVDPADRDRGLAAVLATRCGHPDLGEQTVLRHSGRRHHVTTGGIGFVIGVYDGAIGPGTGSFLVFALVGWVGYAFVEASAKAKITNFATNLGALMVFAPQGVVLWRLGLAMGWRTWSVATSARGRRWPAAPLRPGRVRRRVRAADRAARLRRRTGCLGVPSAGPRSACQGRLPHGAPGLAASRSRRASGRGSTRVGRGARRDQVRVGVATADSTCAARARAVVAESAPGTGACRPGSGLRASAGRARAGPRPGRVGRRAAGAPGGLVAVADRALRADHAVRVDRSLLGGQQRCQRLA